MTPLAEPDDIQRRIIVRVMPFDALRGTTVPTRFALCQLACSYGVVYGLGGFGDFGITFPESPVCRPHYLPSALGFHVLPSPLDVMRLRIVNAPLLSSAGLVSMVMLDSLLSVFLVVQNPTLFALRSPTILAPRVLVETDERFLLEA